MKLSYTFIFVVYACSLLSFNTKFELTFLTQFQFTQYIVEAAITKQIEKTHLCFDNAVKFERIIIFWS